MTVDGAVELFLKAFIAAAKFAGPMLVVALVVGVVVGILQAATQVNEASVSFVVKVIAVTAVLAVLGPAIGTQMVDYTRRSIEGIALVVRR